MRQSGKEARPAIRKRSVRGLFRKNSELFTLSIPGVLYIFVFCYLPMFGIMIAFKNYQFNLGIFGSKWIGFDNFKFLFGTPVAWRITRNTVLYSLSYFIFTNAAALILAILLQELRRRWIKLHQTILFLPYFVSWVVAGYIAQAFLDHESGFLNHLLELLGLQPHKWYFESGVWPYILTIAHEWKAIGFSTLLYFAGIMGISQEYYEAARIDGATKLQMAIKITIPMLMPLISILTILSLGNMFRGDFGLHYFVPNNSSLVLSSTDIIDTYVYRALKQLSNLGMTAAVGFYQSLVGFVLVIAANYTIRKINDENSLF
ncbi:MAG: sugar ABC transporter permease [Paenibacillaceae bacterium]|nr:sugar ABC transporter permease [Paenibacillaceae bacterium]